MGVPNFQKAPDGDENTIVTKVWSNGWHSSASDPILALPRATRRPNPYRVI